MIGVGFGVFFAGYSLLVYGWSQLRSKNASLVSIVWPGSYRGDFPDAAKNQTGGGSGSPSLPFNNLGRGTGSPGGTAGPPGAPNPNQNPKNPNRNQPASNVLPGGWVRIK